METKDKETFKTICEIASKVMDRLKDYGLPPREKLFIIMDFELANNLIPLDLKMLNSPGHEETLMHDYVGIYKSLDRENKCFSDKYFVPRSALRG